MIGDFFISFLSSPQLLVSTMQKAEDCSKSKGSVGYKEGRLLLPGKIKPPFLSFSRGDPYVSVLHRSAALFSGDSIGLLFRQRCVRLGCPAPRQHLGLPQGLGRKYGGSD